MKHQPKETKKARLILRHASATKKSFWDLCTTRRKSRHGSGGALKDEEQDLLRAMLVFAAAGLDALVKQLIRDALQALASKDPDVQAELEKFVSRQLREAPFAADSETLPRTREFLAKILASPTPHSRLVEEYVRELTGDSLQSAEQLFRAARALGLKTDSLGIDSKELREIFVARNQIIHEMDISLERSGAGVRKRRSRTVDDMTAKATALLKLAEQLVDAIEEKLCAGA